MDWNSASTELRLSYEQTEEGTVKLLSESHGEYNINSQGLLKTPSGGLPTSSSDNYRIAGRDVGVYRTVGSGASAVVHQAIHVATGNVLAVKNINVLDKDKRAQMLQELRTLCDITAKAVPGLEGDSPSLDGTRPGVLGEEVGKSSSTKHSPALPCRQC